MKATRGRRSRGRFARGRKAIGICDRSGFKYLLKDLVKEPGTGLLVARDMNDGKWNRVDHPQNFPADTSESIALENPRPERSNATQDLLFDDTLLILDNDGVPIFID